MNIVSTTGYGDMVAYNDTERVALILLINLGDALFAVAFGLLAGLTMKTSSYTDAEKVFNKMDSVLTFLKKFKIEEEIKRKITNFYSYSWSL